MEQEDPPPTHTLWQGFPGDPFLAHLNNTCSQEHEPCMPPWGNVANWRSPPIWPGRPPPPTVPRLDHFESSHSASLKIRLDVSRVQVSNAHEEAGPGEGPQLSETECALWSGWGGQSVRGPGQKGGGSWPGPAPPAESPHHAPPPPHPGLMEKPRVGWGQSCPPFPIPGAARPGGEWSMQVGEPQGLLSHGRSAFWMLQCLWPTSDPTPALTQEILRARRGASLGQAFVAQLLLPQPLLRPQVLLSEVP